MSQLGVTGSVPELAEGEPISPGVEPLSIGLGKFCSAVGIVRPNSTGSIMESGMSIELDGGLVGLDGWLDIDEGFSTLLCPAIASPRSDIRFS